MVLMSIRMPKRLILGLRLMAIGKMELKGLTLMLTIKILTRLSLLLVFSLLMHGANLLAYYVLTLMLSGTMNLKKMYELLKQATLMI